MTDKQVFYSELPKKLGYETPSNPELTQNITTLIKKVYFKNDLSNLKDDVMTTGVSKFDINFLRVEDKNHVSCLEKRWNLFVYLEEPEVTNFPKFFLRSNP